MGEFNGCFVIIAMLLWAVKHTGAPLSTWLTRDELINHVSTCIEKVSVMLQKEQLPISDIGPCIYAAYLVQFRALLEVAFHKSAQFYLAREWEPTKLDWSLGLF